MERLIRRLLMVWLLLLGGVLLAYHLGYSSLAYPLMWAVAIGSPIVVLLLLAHTVLGLREVWHRVQALRRARHWRRKPKADNRWMDTQWEDIDV
ncbi:hypothetical protein [Hymenobacter nivis]|uniref:hypothetical protein n=1 Tax=Hymenobacter nivis TaxID=1850093 RepID=UPI001375F131|nr:hypothetical protein [Hymenobacter nivis]